MPATTTFSVGPHYFRFHHADTFDVRRLLPSYMPFLVPSDIEHHRLFEMTMQFSMSDATTAYVSNNALMTGYAFESALHQTLLIHASVVACQGKAYLFLGKSGTGKSTHAALWLKYFDDCYLLNDDNPVVHWDAAANTVMAYGSPWSGKTPCYRQESMPVAAIVRLEQAPFNEIRRLNAAYAFAALLPSCSFLQTVEPVYNGVIQTVKDVVSRVPVCLLRCLPDEAAARLCRETVTGISSPSAKPKNPPFG